jgi:hypothetical protein
MALGPKKFSWFLAIALACGSSALALVGGPAAVAQNDSGNSSGGFYQPPGGAYGGGWGGGWGGGFVDAWGAGSTPMGSYMMGLGSAIRAQGQYNLDTSGAAINLEEARKRNIENDVRWTNAYFEMRRINRENTHPKRSPTPPETWARLAQQAAPNRLPSSLLDPVTGKIDWPLALQSDAFKADRDTLDQLFAHRAATNGAIGLDGFTQIRKSTDDALAKLRSQIRQIDSRNYMEARNFLTSLAHEANFASSG